MTIISFDGLNRSGKGTQIFLLNQKLNKDYPIEIIRGDGSREGIGNPKYYDPPSEWWVDWQRNKEKSIGDWNQAYLKLKYENLNRISELPPETIFLMDRCYISRWFTVRQSHPDTILSEVYSKAEIIPHLYIILNPSKKTLLERCDLDDSEKRTFRKGVIENHYPLWGDVIRDAKKYLGDEMDILPSEDLFKTEREIENIVSHLIHEKK